MDCLDERNYVIVDNLPGNSLLLNSNVCENWGVPYASECFCNRILGFVSALRLGRKSVGESMILYQVLLVCITKSCNTWMI